MKPAPALTVIDGGRALEPACQAMPAPLAPALPSVLAAARQLARADFAAMMQAMNNDSHQPMFIFSPSDEAGKLNTVV